MKCIINGSRAFAYDRNKMLAVLDRIFSKTDFSDLTIVSGTCKGPDRWGEEWARCRGVRIEQYPAQWNTYGRRAGFVRNREMVYVATHVVSFWDGHSRGTKHVIDLARENGLPVRIVTPAYEVICVKGGY
jgi:hypothetical protein